MNRNSNALSGEFYVLSRLLRKGLDASLTLGNTKSVDILIRNPETGKKFDIEVKTTALEKEYGGKWGKHLFWFLKEGILERKEYSDKSFYFVFVWLQPNDDYEIFIVPGKKVIDYVRFAIKKSTELGVKKNYNLRIGDDTEYVLDKTKYKNNFNPFFKGAI
ncbi:MAG: hypothetical protein FWF00_06350 [Endomicrobia bacterium]|nr:hypothetical protein [Endomicrobiia bacterium]MCL2507286.1 hypothetical protein [Endomicrobiia bacterium]